MEQAVKTRQVKQTLGELYPHLDSRREYCVVCGSIRLDPNDPTGVTCNKSKCLLGVGRVAAEVMGPVME